MGKDALKLTISRVIVLLITIITGMVLSRLRSLEEYGTYSQILMIVNLVVAIFSLGLPNSINYFIPRCESDEEKKIFLSTFYSASSVLGIVSGGLLFACLPLVASYFNNNLIIDFWFVLCFLPFINVIKNSISNLLIVFNKSTNLLLYNVVSSLLLLGAVVIVEVLNLGFFAYMIAYVFAEGVLAIWTYIMAARLSKGLALNINMHLLKSIFAFSIPLGLASSVSTLNSELDKLVIGNLMSTDDVALYANAAKELPITVVPTSITAVLLPNVVKDVKDGNFERAIKKWADAIEIGYIFVCFCAMACIVFAPQIITLLYSEKYLPSVNIFRIYSLVLLLRCTFFGMLLNATGKTRFIFYTTLASLAINIALNYGMFFLIGFEGPAIATFISIFVIQFVQLILSSKVCHAKFTEIFPWMKISIITVINALIGCLSYLAVRFCKLGTSGKDILICIGIGIIMTIVYGVVYWKRLSVLWKRLNKKEGAPDIQ